MSDDREQFRERAGRLTPRELRVLALVMEGRSTQSACEMIGIAPGTFESHKQAIRRKLSVPRGKRLEAFLRDFAAELPEGIAKPAPLPPEPVAPPPDEYSDRRIRWLLRLTINEINEISHNAQMRAQLLGQTVERIQSDDSGEAKGEIEDLQFVADELRKTAERLLVAVRERSAQRA